MIRLRSIIWAIFAAILVISGISQFIGQSPLQTNLMALLPKTQYTPAVDHALNRLTQVAESRVVFLVEGKSSIAVKKAAGNLTALVKQNPAFKSIQSTIPPIDSNAMLRFFIQHRFHLLTDDDQQQLDQTTAFDFLEQRFIAKVYAPFKLGPSIDLAQDPFGFLDRYLALLPFQRSALIIEDGWLTVHQDQTTYILISAELAGSAYDGQLQAQLKTTLEKIDHEFLSSHPEIHVLRTGAALFALTARERAEHEVDLIGLGSLLGISLLMFLVFGSLRPLFFGLLSVAIGIGAAIFFTVKLNGELHLLTLVFGASLTGEAIDYAIQYFVARTVAKDAWQAARKIFPAITIAITTSFLGYLALLVLPFPGLNQIALFSMIGLVCAYLTVVLLIPIFFAKPVKINPTVLMLPQRFSCWWKGNTNSMLPRVAPLLLVVFSVPGWFVLTVEDDIRLLANPAKSLLQQEQQIRQLTGISGPGPFLLVQANTVEELLQREGALTGQLRRLQREGMQGEFQALSDFVPSIKQQQQSYHVLNKLIVKNEKKLNRLLEKLEFKQETINTYRNQFKTSAAHYLTLEQWLQEPISTPFRLLWLGSIDKEVASMVLLQGFSIEILEQVAREIPGVSVVDKVGKLSLLFAQYRRLGMIGLGIALILIYIVLARRYGWKSGGIVLLPTLFAVGLTLSSFGYLGLPLTLFNVMALMLVLGVGVNYAIFLHEGGERSAPILVGVVLSAMTTLFSFGLLALSSMPALNRFGLTLLMGIGFAVVLTPFVLNLLVAVRDKKFQRRRRPET